MNGELVSRSRLARSEATRPSGLAPEPTGTKTRPAFEERLTLSALVDREPRSGEVWLWGQPEFVERSRQICAGGMSGSVRVIFAADAVAIAAEAN